MLSVPPARITRASPRRMARAAQRTACNPEPQAWLTVKAGRSSGTPARWAIWRAVLGPPPAWRAWPKITWSTRSGRPGARPPRDRAAAAAASPGRAADSAASAPPNLPMAVRTGAANTMSPGEGGETRAERLEDTRSGLPADVDRFRLGVGLERLLAQLAAEAALLVAAERGAGVVPVVLVDPHRARLHLPRDLVRLADVAGPDAGGEAVDVGVGLLHRVLDVAERDHHQHRSEDLLPRHGHVVAHPVEDGRLHEPALAADGRRLAAVSDPRTLAAAGLDVAQHALALLGRHQRAETRLGVERIARDQAAGAFHQALDQLGVDLLLDEEARAGGADLALAVEDAVVGTLHGGIEVGVG